MGGGFGTAKVLRSSSPDPKSFDEGDAVTRPGLELELIEPYLYLPFAEDGADAAADRFTAALESRLV